MEYRLLGSTGLRVSVLGLGCNNVGRRVPGRTRAEMVRLLEHAADAGVTFFDTADVYATGESELLLGEVFGRGRREVVIATKVGLTRRLPDGLLARVMPVLRAMGRRVSWVTRAGFAVAGRNFSPEYLRLAVDGCRRRLQTDCLDLLQLHSPPASVMQRDDALATLERLRTEGAIRFYGVAFGDWQQPITLPRHPGVSTLQIPISVVDDGPVLDVLDWAGTRGIGVIGNQPFKKGTLLRAARSVRARDVLRAVTQLSAVSTVLTGTTSIDHLRENLAAVEGPPLTPDEIQRLRSTLS